MQWAILSALSVLQGLTSVHGLTDITTIENSYRIVEEITVDTCVKAVEQKHPDARGICKTQILAVGILHEEYMVLKHSNLTNQDEINWYMKLLDHQFELLDINAELLRISSEKVERSLGELDEFLNRLFTPDPETFQLGNDIAVDTPESELDIPPEIELDIPPEVKLDITPEIEPDSFLELPTIKDSDDTEVPFESEFTFTDIPIGKIMNLISDAISGSSEKLVENTHKQLTVKDAVDVFADYEDRCPELIWNSLDLLMTIKTDKDTYFLRNVEDPKFYLPYYRVECPISIIS